MTAVGTPTPRSELFRPSPCPLSPERRRRVSDLVSRRARACLDDAGCTVTAADGRHLDASLPADAAPAPLLRRLLDDLAGELHADLIGGVNATRLDRALGRPHPHLHWDDAVTLLTARGRAPRADGCLDARQAAALVHHGGGLPLHLTDLPGEDRDAVLLPFGGRACEAEAGRVRLDLDALERYVLGAA